MLTRQHPHKLLFANSWGFYAGQPCGGAIPLCMVDEFDIPAEIIDRKVTKMKMISPSNREVDVGKTLSETEYIGMCRREVLDAYLRNRAKEYGATVNNGLFMRMEQVPRSSSQRAACARHLSCSGYGTDERVLLHLCTDSQEV
jgi:hypothetical protein